MCEMQIKYKQIDHVILEKIVDSYGEGVREYIFIRENTFALAALDGEIPVGFICVTPAALAYPLEQLVDAFIEIYEVHEDYRRQGIGRHLVTCAEEWARSAGFRQIRTHHNNEAANAIKLSNSLNYGLCPYDYWVDGKMYSGYWVSKVLHV